MPANQLRSIASDIDVGVLFSGRGLDAVVKVDKAVPDEVAEGVHAGYPQAERLKISLNGGVSSQTSVAIVENLGCEEHFSGHWYLGNKPGRSKLGL